MEEELPPTPRGRPVVEQVVEEPDAEPVSHEPGGCRGSVGHRGGAEGSSDRSAGKDPEIRRGAGATEDPGGADGWKEPNGVGGTERRGTVRGEESRGDSGSTPTKAEPEGRGNPKELMD